MAYYEFCFSESSPKLCAYSWSFFWFSGRFAIKLSVVWSWEKLFLLNKQAGKRVEVQMKKIMRKRGILYHL